ncbi:hypothetical protein KAH27_00610, partial [bacterium]|nr:hypothetical protein [bacterium]
MKKLLIIAICFAAFNSLATKEFVKPENAEYLRGVIEYVYFWHLDPANFFEHDQDTNIEILIKE